ncbi:exodeoxyribonuclease VII large subunit [Thalassorhabdus alkalitolerans]|uniref:Exodeoxyribonuclease 7 large subunit n=1 Tax=Thalassorhabdus alkalitolerans TaxID=2282697 RepID=A0ABW0YTB2_9BACI
MNGLESRWISVSQLTRQIKAALEMDDGLQHVWLRGEISNFKKHSRGHMYFTLKDDKSRISAVMFAGNNRQLSFEPENGMKVLIKGQVSVYEPFGQYQLYVREMEPDGIGQLYLRFEQLKKQLETEGLFRPEIKKQLPKMPREIGVVTSPTGAAIRDILTTLKRRFPLARVTLFPVLVQGRDAAPSIANAIKQADETSMFDVLIVGRGGGSIEDLWAFNEEIVARALFELSVPVVSAVGHETDFTIADFVADVRAATPTAAAELIVPDIVEVEGRLRRASDRLIKAAGGRVASERERLERLKKSYAFKYPEQLLRQKEQELDRLIERLSKGSTRSLHKSAEQAERLYARLLRSHPSQLAERSRTRLEQGDAALKKEILRILAKKQEELQNNISKLNLLNPLQVMNRGYNVTYDENQKLVQRVEDVEAGDRVSIQVKNGSINCQVESTGPSLVKTESVQSKGGEADG